MKKIALISFVAALAFLAACTSKEGGMTKEEKKNLEASQAVAKAFQTGDVSEIDKFVDSSFVDHTDRGDMNRDSLKSMIAWVHSKGGDMKMEVLKEAVEGDYVFTWMRLTGTSDGDMGMPPGPYDMSPIQLTRCKDGKVVEHWEFMEPREMMKMMPPPSQPKDTATHM